MKEHVALGTVDSHHRREAGLRTKLTMQKRGEIRDVRFLVISLPHRDTLNPELLLDFPVIEVKNLFLMLKICNQHFPN